ncbi:MULTISPECIES: PIN domain-containing protein [unclassified Pseudomonas]|uniref:PIN domain-containing protein n=1 Tax=unclassified Pseudomonas TaxID=196821 RepID=UPI000A0AA9C9|nr:MULTISPECIES: PIN domain-containing protein [unclassified Pseudomonas]SMF23821.1 hypothetical protein SAMN02745962_02453 [Pseudomonas sp. LAIL14HWK12:I11]SMR74265.1 hypothetical protein SAMN05661028_01957 [Pseudomonas sp. LAIL14HWK12:I10]SOD03577.1 hypothetical protein SAMN05660296_02458 [Pseudomonas sp. LAIL14HWK12:I8]
MTSKFIKTAKYPDPSGTFSFNLAPKDRIIDTCLFILDANVLLLPYTADAKSLNEIRKVYEKLVKQNRLYVPAQAAREFLDNRATKLSEVHDFIYKKQNQSFTFIKGFPLLDEINEFKELVGIENQIKELLKKYRDSAAKTLNIIKSWGWDDPVSKIYHEVLSSVILDDSDTDENKLEKDLEFRNKNKIPPGYKDGGKSDNQIGDLLIWHELLNIAKTRQEHVVFVSGDEKNDWWHQSSGKGLYPRFELVDEFRRSAHGKSFHIISLSELLEKFNANSAAVAAVKTSEEQASQPVASDGFITTAKNCLNLIKFFRDLLASHKNEQQHILINRQKNDMHDFFDPALEDYPFSNFGNNASTKNLMSTYEAHKIDIIIMRETLLESLPHLRNDDMDFYYSRPTNPIGVESVIDDFERIVKTALLNR